MNFKNTPKISIVSASYNHERYVGNFIKSVLNQSFKNFELIIIDDASSDNNLKIIKSFSDSRIKVIQHSYNQGPSISINDGIKESRGEYISFLATDDEIYPNYLEEGINFLDKNIEYNALCFQLEGIDNNNEKLKDNEFQQTLKFKNIEHFRLIKEMFMTGNMIPAPGEIIRNSIIKSVGLFNPSLLQTQDYDFHVRTLLKNKIYVYQKPIVKYRQSSGNNNIDNHNSASTLRNQLELPIVLDNFLNIEINLFNQVFGKESKIIGEPTKETIPYFLGIIAINTSDPIRQRWGYQTLLKFIQNKNNIMLLNSLFSIEFKDITSQINKMIYSVKRSNNLKERILNIIKSKV